jgi:hypothetical protein
VNPTSYPMNPFAPSYFQGMAVASSADTGYEPRPYVYIYNPPALFGGGGGNTVEVKNDSVAIQTDSDFLLLGWYIALFTGAFSIQLADSSGYLMMSGNMNSGAISQNSAKPTVFVPSHPFPAGGKIQIVDLLDLSGALNPTQIAFVGIKLFRAQRTQ